jgi:hypothetical protein
MFCFFKQALVAGHCGYYGVRFILVADQGVVDVDGDYAAGDKNPVALLHDGSDVIPIF